MRFSKTTISVLVMVGGVFLAAAAAQTQITRHVDGDDAGDFYNCDESGYRMVDPSSSDGSAEFDGVNFNTRKGSDAASGAADFHAYDEDFGATTASGQKMYWTDWQTGKVQRADLDGSNIEDLTTAGGHPQQIALDLSAGKMYWAEQFADRIRRANLDGSNIQVLVTGLNAVSGLALDLGSGKMYWSTFVVPQKIQRADFDGSNIEDLITVGLSLPLRIALDVTAGKMYWTDNGTNKIQRADLDGSNIEDLVTGLDAPSGIALDLEPGKMYWADTFDNRIQRANLDGSMVEDVLTGTDISSPRGLALDPIAGKLYWTETSTDKIRRADLDGSGIEDLVASGLMNPLSMALAAQALMLDLDIKPGSCPNPFNRHGNGVLPVALPGSDIFDVSEVVIASIRLSRADGEGGSVAPNEGPPGPHSVFEDLASPFEGDQCDCHELAGDGIVDLSVKFKTQEVVDALQLDELLGGQFVLLVVTGNLINGTPFSAEDCIWLVPPDDMVPANAMIESEEINAFVEVTPVDLIFDSDGFTNFARAYVPGTMVTLTAESVSPGGRTFLHWVIDGTSQPVGESTISVTITDDLILDPVYGGCQADLTGDGSVNAADLALLLGDWGPCP